MLYSQLFSVFASRLEWFIEQGGYAVLFVTTALEGVPLVGMAVPGHVALVLGGFLAKAGTLNLYAVVGLSFAGAVLGDCIGYHFGKVYGLSFIDRLRPYFFIKNSHLEKASSLLNAHTGKAMIIGRFSPVTRALMPFLVGAHGIPSKKFWFFNLTGAASWVAVSVLGGYAFGTGYYALSGYMSKWFISAIIIAILTIWGYRFINMRFHVFARYELFALGLNLIALYALARTLQDVFMAPSPMARFDVYANSLMADYVSPFIAKIAWVVTTLGSLEVLAAVGLAIGLLYFLKKKWRSGAIMIVSVMSTGVALGILKQLFLRVRPDNTAIVSAILDDPSFPSGHAGMAAAFFFAIAYLTAPRIRPWVKRELWICVCVILPLLVGLSRVILNAHWASDVIAGWALGLFLATGSVLLVRYVSVLVIRKELV